MQDPYASFARRYDWFCGPSGVHDPDNVAFFRTLFAQNHVRTVLDCACGTGQDLRLFHSLGCQAFGSDLSEAMLGQARLNLSRSGLDLPLIRADFRQLPFRCNTPFDAVVCLSTSLPHLSEETEVLDALRSMRQVLRLGGILVLSQGICDRQLRERPRFIPVVNERDRSRVFVMDYLGERLRIHVLDLLHGDDSREFNVSTFDYRVILREDYERLLAQAGYQERKYYGNFRFEPYSRESSSRLIIVARTYGA